MTPTSCAGGHRQRCNREFARMIVTIKRRNQLRAKLRFVSGDGVGGRRDSSGGSGASGEGVLKRGLRSFAAT
jgi:hypothetical protein